jgi:DNA-binding MarR family transcriptional regulator
MDYTAASLELLRLLGGAKSMLSQSFHELARGEAFVLRLLAQGKAAWPKQLSAMTETSTARMAATLNSLEQKGYVVRQTDQTDRRKTRVRITEAGQDAIVQKERAVLGFVAQTLEALGEEDTRELLRILGRLNELPRARVACQYKGGNTN